MNDNSQYVLNVEGHSCVLKSSLDSPYRLRCSGSKVAKLIIFQDYIGRVTWGMAPSTGLDLFLPNPTGLYFNKIVIR